MSSNWEKVYPERINWTNRPGSKTPINDDNLNKGDKALRVIDDRVLSLGVLNDYVLSANNWVRSSDEFYYKWQYTISCDIYSDDSSPDAIVYISGGNETDLEHSAIDYIGKVYVDSNGIKVYATSKPEIDVNLRIRGK